MARQKQRRSRSRCKGCDVELPPGGKNKRRWCNDCFNASRRPKRKCLDCQKRLPDYTGQGQASQTLREVQGQAGKEAARNRAGDEMPGMRCRSSSRPLTALPEVPVGQAPGRDMRGVRGKVPLRAEASQQQASDSLRRLRRDREVLRSLRHEVDRQPEEMVSRLSPVEVGAQKDFLPPAQSQNPAETEGQATDLQTLRREAPAPCAPVWILRSRKSARRGDGSHPTPELRRRLKKGPLPGGDGPRRGGGSARAGRSLMRRRGLLRVCVWCD